MFGNWFGDFDESLLYILIILLLIYYFRSNILEGFRHITEDINLLNGELIGLSHGITLYKAQLYDVFSAIQDKYLADNKLRPEQELNMKKSLIRNTYLSCANLQIDIFKKNNNTCNISPEFKELFNKYNSSNLSLEDIKFKHNAYMNYYKMFDEKLNNSFYSKLSKKDRTTIEHSFNILSRSINHVVKFH